MDLLKGRKSHRSALFPKVILVFDEASEIPKSLYYAILHPRSRRHPSGPNGRPINYKDQSPSFRDDCGLLKLDINDVKYFQVCTTNTTSTSEVPRPDIPAALHSLEHSGHGVLRQLLKRSRLAVHKLRRQLVIPLNLFGRMVPP